MESLWRELRFALRSCVNRPVFAMTVVLAIALGVGATTAVFSVVDRILFRSLPYPEAGRLVTFGFVAPIEPNEFMLGADYFEWRSRDFPFESVASFGGVQDCDLTEYPPARLGCAQVEATFLPTLGIIPFLGRNFSVEEDHAGGPPVVLLSFGFWKRRFGGDREIVGKTVSLDGRLTTIVGVLPADFELPTLVDADLLVPQKLDQAALVRRSDTSQVVIRAYARLKPGVTIRQAAEALGPSFRESLNWVPPSFRHEVSLSVRSVRDRQIQDARLASWILLAAVLSVLLIACANVASLLLAHSSSHRRELAIRAALGAGRGRLLRQSLAESVLLALLGGTLGCGLAILLLSIFSAVAPEGILRLRQATLDARVLLFSLTVSITSGILLGLMSASREPTACQLVGRAEFYVPRSTFRRLLISVQVAISFVLLAGAGLLLRSLINLEQAPLGMNTSGVVLADVALNPRLYSDTTRRLQFFEALESQLKQLPGVAAFALSDSLPPSGRSRASVYAGIRVAGRPRLPRGTGGMVTWRMVTPGYFSTLGIPIRRGRSFEEGDRKTEVNVAILSQALAQRLFGGQDPLGQSVRFAEDGPWYAVVGIAGDVKNDGLAQPSAPEYYVARKHSPEGALSHSTLVLRTSLSPSAVASWVRSTVVALDPVVPVTIETLSRRVGRLEARPRFNALLLGTFAAFGVLLAAIGIYGVLGFFVATRTREIGVRIAIGARSCDILRLTLGEGFMSMLSGIIAGLAGAYLLTRWLASLLVDVRASDPFIFAGVALLLILVALAASYVPARRAMAVDPMTALREG